MTNIETSEKPAAVAALAAHVAPTKGRSKKGAPKKKGAHTAHPAAKGRKAKAAAPKKEGKAAKKATKPVTAKKSRAPRAEGKGAKIIEMISRPKGATLAEIMKETGWQAHSVRGFLSIAGKKKKLKIDSSKSESGERTYRIA